MIQKLVLFLSLSASPTAFAGPLRIVTEKIDADCASTVLEFEIRGVPESRTVALTRIPGGEGVPCQVKERSRNSVTITWMADALKKGGEAAWEVDLIKLEQPEKDHRVHVKAAGEDFEVLFGDRLFTRLVHDPQSKPYLFPILGPNGKLISRQYPMKAKVQGEDQDHPHHRSLWFTHGEVGGVDFWSEGQKQGRIRKAKVERVESGPVFGRTVTVNDWVKPDGTKLLEDRREIFFYPLERGEAFIDVAVTLKATEGDVELGDTKEGSFGIRLAESMKEKRGGIVVTSRGVRGTAEAWGRPAEWIDYSGSVEGDTVGVAILDHPSSFRHPTHWHVRDYGLFAANPFGYHDFYPKDPTKNGAHKLEKGQSMSFRYRVYFHHGRAEDARVREVYEGFARPPKLQPRTEKA